MGNENLILDLFAGPGGHDEGVRRTGHAGPLLGIEWDETACLTAEAAGHPRLMADVSKLDPLDFSGISGLIGSPPCQSYSHAGKKKGLHTLPLILEALDRIDSYQDIFEALLALEYQMTDDRSLLVLEPLRWALALMPPWIVLEQVPTVLPIWQKVAEVLRRVGYTVETGILNAEEYGVPQSRRRAILTARSAEFTAVAGPAKLPTPTHSRFNPAKPDWSDPALPKWVSIREAMSGSGFWQPEHAPAGSIQTWQFAGAGATARKTSGQVPRDMGSPAHTITGKATAAWTLKYGHVGSGINVSVTESALLQSFPRDYPWQGGKVEQFRQLGDAIPPLLAQAIVEPHLLAQDDSPLRAA